MKNLSLEQMEEVSGGSRAWDAFGCGMSIFGMVTALTAVASLTVITGGTAAVFAIAWLGGGLSTGINCGKALSK